MCASAIRRSLPETACQYDTSPRERNTGCLLGQETAIWGTAISIRRTELDILHSLETGRSPEMTFSRKPGLFLSFKLTNSEPILAL